MTRRDHGPDGLTDRQREVGEVFDGCGSLSETARRLGCSAPNVAIVLRARARNLALPLPVFRKPAAGAASVIAELQAIAIRLELLEQVMERLDRHVHERPSQLVEWRPDHRRLVDGGQHTRTQRGRVRAAS